MDFQFSSSLQKTLQDLGKTGKFAPPTSQDPADVVLHEYFVAETARSLFDKRKKAALEGLKSVGGLERIAGIVANARKGVTGSFDLTDTENYSSQLSVKSPVKGIDHTLFVNELIRLGVDQVTITKALAAAKTEAKPAETYTVSIKTTK